MMKIIWQGLTRGLVDNDEDYIESVPTSYTDVRQINKEMNELKGKCRSTTVKGGGLWYEKD